jgi:multidrug efflux pump subunit AcrA (membrane-fusion protein)
MPSVANAGGADPETTGEAADDEVDHLEGSVTVEVIEGSVRRLKTDQFVSLDFEVPGLGYVWIPKEAIQVRQGRQVVYVVNREHGRTCVMERPVMTGDESKAQMEIKSGLNPGEQIVIEGVTSLQHQQEVAVVQTREADTGPERRL